MTEEMSNFWICDHLNRHRLAPNKICPSFCIHTKPHKFDDSYCGLEMCAGVDVKCERMTIAEYAALRLLGATK